MTDDDPKALLLKAGRSRIEQTSAMAHYHSVWKYINKNGLRLHGDRCCRIIALNKVPKVGKYSIRLVAIPNNVGFCSLPY